MKTFERQAAQGDMMLVRIDKLPEGVQPIPAENGEHILAHSETGHHHVVLERPGLQHYSGMDVLRSYLVVPEGEPVVLKHKRDHHTHEELEIKPGIYALVRQREHDVAQGWRYAAD